MASNFISPTAHIGGISGPVFTPSLQGGSKGTPGVKGEFTGQDKGATHRPGDQTGADKGGVLGYNPSTLSNPVNPDMTGKIAASIMMNNMMGQAAVQKPPQNQKSDEVHKFWVAERDTKEPQSLPQTPGFPTDVHEINKVQETPTDPDSGGGQGTSYFPQDQETEEKEKSEEKKEEEKLEAEEIKEAIVVDEAFSWNGHIAEYHYSPEKLHTNSLAFISAMLPFRTPISNQ